MTVLPLSGQGKLKSIQGKLKSSQGNVRSLSICPFWLVLKWNARVLRTASGRNGPAGSEPLSSPAPVGHVVSKNVRAHLGPFHLNWPEPVLFGWPDQQMESNFKANLRNFSAKIDFIEKQIQVYLPHPTKFHLFGFIRIFFYPQPPP